MPRLSQFRILAVAFLFLISGLSSEHCEATDTERELQIAVSQLENWANSIENGQQWREHLNLNLLEAQATLGHSADIDELTSIQQRFSGHKLGLSPEFQQASNAISNHIAVLANRDSGPLSLIQSAQASGVPSSTVDLDGMRNKLIGAISSLKQYYDSDASNYEVGQSLQLDQLHSFLQGSDFENQPNALGAARLNEAFAKFSSLMLRQHDAHYGRVLESFSEFRSSYELASNPEATASQYQPKLNQLSLAVQSLAQSGSRDAAKQAGHALGWLDAAGFSNAGMQSAIKHRYSKPNMHVAVSSGLFSKYTTRPLDKTQPVCDTILERLIQGTAYIRGTTNIKLIPNPWQAHALIDLTGTVDADTYTKSDSGKITVFTGSHSDFNFRRDVYAGLGGFFANDAYGDLQFGSYFKGTNKKCRLIEKISKKKYCESKAESEAISRCRSTRKLKKQFQESTDELLGKGSDALGKVATKKIQYGRWLPSAWLSTTSSHLVLTAKRISNFDLGAPTAPNPQMSVGADIEVQVHESLLSNYINPMFAGRKFGSNDFRAMLGRETAEEETIVITFADARPIEFEFDNEQLAVAITAKQFVFEGEEFNDAIKMRIPLQLVRNGGNIGVAIPSKPSIELIEPSASNEQNSAFIEMLGELVTGVLENRAADGFIYNGLPLDLIPHDRLPESAKEMIGDLRLTQLRIVDGWLYGGWSKVSDDQSYPMDLAAVSSNLPAGFKAADGSDEDGEASELELDLDDSGSDEEDSVLELEL